MVRFADWGCGIQIREGRIFATQEAAEEALPKAKQKGIVPRTIIGNRTFILNRDNQIFFLNRRYVCCYSETI